MTAKKCSHCNSALGAADHILREAYDKIDIPPVKPHVTRVEIHDGVCPCCAEKTKVSAVPESMEKGSPFSSQENRNRSSSQKTWTHSLAAATLLAGLQSY
ncbi:MAG: IS66 family transposase zinc-finger binding domain-containing protein [Alphaproteobacteria bacterium]|nr:IS66 family transposase zinc-finger binding domain-containing protein [Alphaproteobacteria bacterium]